MGKRSIAILVIALLTVFASGVAVAEPTTTTDANDGENAGLWPVEWDSDDYSDLSDFSDFVEDSINQFVTFLVGIPIWMAQSLFAGIQNSADGILSFLTSITSEVASGGPEALDQGFQNVEDWLPGGVSSQAFALVLLLGTFAVYKMGVSRLE